MARGKAVDVEPSEHHSSSRPVRKRTLPGRYRDDLEGLTLTKRRRVQGPLEVAERSSSRSAEPAAGFEGEPRAQSPAPTPTPKRRGRPPKAASVGAARADPPTPSKRPAADPVKTPTKTPVRTPTKSNGVITPSRRNFADRSARRKSARALIDRVVGDASSEDEGGDEALAREIYGSGVSEDDDLGEDVLGSESELGEALLGTTGTPSKTPRTRKRKTGGKRSPTPPQDLPPHEQYFYHNRPGLTKTSNNTLSSLDLLTHDEYFALLRESKSQHDEDVRYLESLHSQSFPQWAFEVSQGFSICLYGYGSKRHLLGRFASHLYSTTTDHGSDKIVVVNGYVRTTTTREVLTTIGSAVDASQRLAAGNPVVMAQSLLALLSSRDVSITLIIHSIDAYQLRKTATQSILAQLAAHPRVRLVCSTDSPDVSLLWDSGLRSSFNFLFHDCTTFAPYAVELDVVDEVHELLGRKARRVGGRDGVAFVLRSLPENAKSLFRLLVTEVLVAMEEEPGAGEENPGVEYRMLYNKAVEEFICSSEMAFRTLLKEFHDHQMITSRKDILGTELLSVPFRKDELEAILEDIMS